MDLAVTHLKEPGKVVYQGQLRVIRNVGSMAVMEFSDGAIYDVPSAPPALYPGDTVRIYETPKGYEAQLWKSVSSMEAQPGQERG